MDPSSTVLKLDRDQTGSVDVKLKHVRSGIVAGNIERTARSGAAEGSISQNSTFLSRLSDGLNPLHHAGNGCRAIEKDGRRLHDRNLDAHVRTPSSIEARLPDRFEIEQPRRIS
jgi:hypothetical protein